MRNVYYSHRFAAENSRNQLPVWVRPSVKVYDKFGLALKDLMIFFKTAEKTVWKVSMVFNGSFTLPDSDSVSDSQCSHWD